MTAFLKSITINLGDEGRWLHQGLTTSDVWDTSTSLQLKEAGELLFFIILNFKFLSFQLNHQLINTKIYRIAFCTFW